MIKSVQKTVYKQKISQWLSCFCCCGSKTKKIKSEITTYVHSSEILSYPDIKLTCRQVKPLCIFRCEALHEALDASRRGRARATTTRWRLSYKESNHLRPRRITVRESGDAMLQLRTSKRVQRREDVSEAQPETRVWQSASAAHQIIDYGSSEDFSGLSSSPGCFCGGKKLLIIINALRLPVFTVFHTQSFSFRDSSSKCPQM